MFVDEEILILLENLLCYEIEDFFKSVWESLICLKDFEVEIDILEK